MRYRTLQSIWHRGLEEYISKGKFIPVWHLTQDEIDLLVSKGIIKAIPEKKVVVKPTPKKPTPKKRVGTSRKRKKVAVVKKVEKKGSDTPIAPVEPVVKLNEENIDG